VLARRLLILVSALLGLALVAAALAPQQRPAPVPAAPAPQAAEGAPPAGRELALTIRDRPGQAPARLHARVGDTVRLTVHSAGPDTVSVDGLTDAVPVEADAPAELEHFADAPGRYRIVLDEAQRRLGTLLVR
jgi:plastocyanin